MGRPSEKAKFMDDVDITMSLDTRSTASQQLTNLEIYSKNVTFRASYRDIALITSILNRAMESYNHSQEIQTDVNASASPIDARKSSPIPTGRARVTMIKEQVSYS
jgi:vacuolar protein sorting-associated protein 13A/C